MRQQKPGNVKVQLVLSCLPLQKRSDSDALYAICIIINVPHIFTIARMLCAEDNFTGLNRNIFCVVLENGPTQFKCLRLYRIVCGRRYENAISSIELEWSIIITSYFFSFIFSYYTKHIAVYSNIGVREYLWSIYVLTISRSSVSSVQNRRRKRKLVRHRKSNNRQRRNPHLYIRSLSISRPYMEVFKIKTKKKYSL